MTELRDVRRVGESREERANEPARLRVDLVQFMVG